MLGYLSADIICFEKRTLFRERSSRKTVRFEEQIMYKAIVFPFGDHPLSSFTEYLVVVIIDPFSPRGEWGEYLMVSEF